jgi:hypothetical protein
MNPILARGPRLALYLIAWLTVGGLLAWALARPVGLGPAMAAAFLVPPALIYAFACLSSWYVCRATPLRKSSTVALVANLAGSTLMAGAVWLLLLRGWASVVDQLSGGRAGSERLFARESVLLFTVGALLYVLTMALHYIVIAVDESRAAEQRAIELQLLAREAELKVLRAQIDPHFLFNSLHSISALTGTDPAGARRMCLLLGEFLRATLKLGARQRISLAEELDLARRFLEIERVRFGARLAVDQSIDDGVGECLVPPLLLQPLVENAVGHGVAQMIEGGTIRLEARRQDTLLSIRLENPCDPDRPRPLRTGVGLDNVRRRLATQYGGQAALKAESSPDRYRVELTLPWTVA